MPVKALRICLLVLLAALLPVRGAMAAAMLCPSAGAGGEARPAIAEAAVHDHAGAGVAPQQHAHGGGEHGAGAAHGHAGAPDQDQCNLCSAFCSMTPLPAAAARVSPPPALRSAAYPGVSAPAPSFLSGGQERPPRGI